MNGRRLLSTIRTTLLVFLIVSSSPVVFGQTRVEFPEPRIIPENLGSGARDTILVRRAELLERRDSLVRRRAELMQQRAGLLGAVENQKKKCSSVETGSKLASDCKAERAALLDRIQEYSGAVADFDCQVVKAMYEAGLAGQCGDFPCNATAPEDKVMENLLRDEPLQAGVRFNTGWTFKQKLVIMRPLKYVKLDKDQLSVAFRMLATMKEFAQIAPRVFHIDGTYLFEQASVRFENSTIERKRKYICEMVDAYEQLDVESP